MSQPLTLLPPHEPPTSPDRATQTSIYPRTTYLNSRRQHPAGGHTGPASAATDTPVDLRAVFGSAAASTWVITAAGEAGPVGFTAISVVSVSLKPPLVSFNLAKNSSSLVTLARSGSAALHLLGEDQEHLARRFAGERALRFAVDDAWQFDHDGLPQVNGVTARLTTQIVDLVDTGDSLLAVARVRHTETGTGAANPLLHLRGGYHSAPRPAAALDKR